jgi:small ligand-binding sensory domain FIST
MTQACRPLGNPVIVTRAEKNIIYELGGRRASDVFAEVAGEERMKDLRHAISSVFLGLPMEPDQDQIAQGQYLVRGIMGIDPESGAIAIGDEARTGQILTFALREPIGAREDLMRMSNELQGNHYPASFGMYFNCMARGKGLYGEEGVDSRALRSTLEGVPFAGFFSGSEIAPICEKTYLHQYSGVLLLVSDPEAHP